MCHLSYTPATILFNLASLRAVLTHFKDSQITQHYSKKNLPSVSMIHRPIKGLPPPLFPTIHQVTGLLCQNNQWSMLSIFPSTDTVILHIRVPVFTVISVGWIIWIMTMDTGQLPDTSFQKAQCRVKRFIIQWYAYFYVFLYFVFFAQLQFYMNERDFKGFAFLFYFLS